MTVAAVGLLEGFHKHHIVPRYLGGNDSPENLVLLHPYDHAIAHFVRWKMYGTHGDAWAFNRLKGWLDDGAFTVKGMCHSDGAKAMIGFHSKTRVRRPHSEETKAKISAAKSGKESNRKGARHSPETIEKMRVAHLGQKAWNKGLTGVNKAWNKGLKIDRPSPNKGRVGLIKWSDEAKAKHSEKIKQLWAKRKQEAVCR